jgi:hypothetical protein
LMATADAKTPIAIYQVITDRCKGNNCQHKLNLVLRLQHFHSAEQQVSNTVFLQEFQEFLLRSNRNTSILKNSLALYYNQLSSPLYRQTRMLSKTTSTTG